jgi:hypothetical protein
MHKTFPLVTLLFTLLLTGCSSGDIDAQGGPIAMRRLTPEQYRNAIEDTFGSNIKVEGRFEPDSRRSGLNAVGTSLVAVTPSGLEQYEALSRNIARQLVAPELRGTALPCQPQSENAADDSCAEMIVRTFGRPLLRRPLTEEEVSVRTRTAAEVTNARQDFYAGVELIIISLLVAPDFLFRVETAEPDPQAEQANRLLLTNLSLASRLSYFLWNRGPDEQLLSAAEYGELTDTEGLARQVDRMLASDQLRGGVRAFFEDLFLFDAFEDLGKDVARYPLYNARMAEDAREQTLRFVVDKLVTRQGDYRDLYTSREMPMTRSLGPLYGVPVRAQEGWETMVFPPDHQRAGLLSQASFSMLHAHPGRSSPTLRGVFMREALLCQTIPEAPADVDFSQFVQDIEAVYKTARDRLKVHATKSSCKKCHRLTDPIGLGLEGFDGIGKFRTTENGATIDTNSNFDGRKFAGAAGLGEAFAENPVVGACLVENLYRYAVGREQANTERRLLKHLEGRFEELGYQVPALMREIALSEGFRTASRPKENT